MGDFYVDTQVEGPAEATTDGGGRFVATLSPDWQIWGPNGGYLASIGLRAAGRAASIQRPVALSCHFLGSARFDRVDLHVEVIRRGRSSESIAVTMRQDGRAILHGMLRTAAEVPGVVHDVAAFPDVRGPNELRSWAELFPNYEGPVSPFWQSVEARPTNPEEILAGEAKVRPPVHRQWHRFAPTRTFTDPFVDAARCVVLLDTMGWPAAENLHPGTPYRAPNLDVSVWFHRRAPDSEWLLSDHYAPVAEGGTIGVSGRVFSERGQLLASGGSQLMCLPVPPAVQSRGAAATSGEPSTR